MTTSRTFAIGVLLAALAFSFASAHAESDSLRPEVSKPLQAAQELMKSKKYKEALVKVTELDVIDGKTPYEVFIIERMRGAAASAAGETDVAAKAFDTVISSARLPVPEQLKLMEAMAGTYYRNKDYHKAIVWTQRYLKDDASNPTMSALLIQSEYLNGDYVGAAQGLNAEFLADDKAARVPAEDRLRLLGSSYQQMKNDTGYIAVLERLVAHYPKKEYWADLIVRIQDKPGFSDRLSLDVYRLQMATGNMSVPNHFMEMAQLALQAGYPAEAKKTIDLGYSSGILGTGAEAERHNRLRVMVNTKFDEDVKAMGQGDSQAASAKEGTALVNIGYNYATHAQFDKAITMMEQGLAKGGIKRPEDGKLRLGLVYFEAGKKLKSVQILKTVQGTDGTADLARLWTYVN
ncbi:tetratricopeptide repeat protein [Glaciimonas sp. GG7]